MQDFFLSANSKDGFFDLYPKVFDSKLFDRIFVIYGGPGTGKSTLMRRLAQAAEERGATAEFYRCSSDMTSLDGVILTHGDKRVGILDGTPPHARSVTAPAVKEEIWDVSRFWDADAIRTHKKAIEKASEEKKRKYRKAYAFLHAAGTLHEEGLQAVSEHFLFEKARKTIQKKVPLLTKGGKAKECFLRCFAMQGEGVIPCLEAQVSSCLYLQGDEYSAEKYLQILASVLQEEKKEHTVFHSPLCPSLADGIFFPASGVLLVKGSLAEKTANSRGIHLSRFEVTDGDKKNRKALQKEERILLKQAFTALREVGEAHFSLEKLYSAAMDFDAMKKESALWKKQMLSALGFDK